MYPYQQESEPTVYPCDLCEFSTLNQTTLRQHIEAKHMGIKYSCDLCDFETASPSYLSRQGVYKVPYFKNFIKSLGEEYQVVEREGNIKAARKNIT